MLPQSPDEGVSSLESARKRLYEPTHVPVTHAHSTPPAAGGHTVPHSWNEPPIQDLPHPGKRHVRLAVVFLIVAFVFFLISLGAAGYFFLYGGNSVSVDKVTIALQGPTTITGGDTVPLSLTITNKNPVALDHATVEIDFPNGTVSASGSLTPYPRFIENLGSIPSGATVTRSVKAILFGGQGQALALPITLTYDTAGSSITFVKKATYPIAISSTPLSVSVDALTETVSGKPITFTLSVRSNATIPIDNVVVANSLPFGFSKTSTSIPLSGTSFYLGTLKPGEVKTMTLTGTLAGQDGEQRVFHFSVGTAASASNPTLVVTYMTQDTPVTITAPFITTTLALNGDTKPDLVIAPGSHESAVVTYANTLSSSVTNATVSILLSGSAIDYNSIQSSNGFYNSTDHTILFSKDTDASLAQMAPGASGIGTFTFATLPAGSPVSDPTITFIISVSGTRVGQSNVPENVNASVRKTVKIATIATFTASSLHSSGPIANTGPIPPQAGQATSYTVVWNVQNTGSTIAGGTVTATLPSYVTYSGKTVGVGSFSYDNTSRTVSWNVGDLAQGATAQAAFQVILTPSTSQKGRTPTLSSSATFSGYDRFAGVQVTASADPVTTETRSDPGYTGTNAMVQ